MKKLFLISVISLFISAAVGNFDRNELNEVAIVYAIGIDQSKKGYRISMQIINPQPIDMPNPDQPPVIVYQSEASTIGKAIANVSRKISRKINLSQVQLVLLGESLVEKVGINTTLNYVLREPELASVVDVLVTKEISASEALNVFAPLEDVPADEIVKVLKNVEKNLGSHQRLFPTQLKAEMISEGKEAVIPTIKLTGKMEEVQEKKIFERMLPKTYIELSGLTVLNEDKKAGWLNDDLSKTYFLLKNRLKNSYFDAPCSKKEEFGLNVVKAASTISSALNHEVPYFDINIKLVGDLDEFNCNLDLSSTDNINKIEDLMEIKLKEDVESLLRKSQKYQIDFVGFGEILMMEHYSDWKKIKPNWKEIYPTSSFDINVQVSIRNYGDINVTS